MKKVPLTYPLPLSRWVRSESGWYSVPWTPAEKEAALAEHFKYVPA